MGEQGPVSGFESGLQQTIEDSRVWVTSAVAVASSPRCLVVPISGALRLRPRARWWRLRRFSPAGVAVADFGRDGTRRRRYPFTRSNDVHGSVGGWRGDLAGNSEIVTDWCGRTRSDRHGHCRPQRRRRRRPRDRELCQRQCLDPLGNGQGGFVAAPAPVNTGAGSGSGAEAITCRDVHGLGPPRCRRRQFFCNVSVLLGDGHGGFIARFAGSPYATDGFYRGSWWSVIFAGRRADVVLNVCRDGILRPRFGVFARGSGTGPWRSTEVSRPT